eukprot:jgi/Mesvir1/9163/Mv13709-RA.1
MGRWGITLGQKHLLLVAFCLALVVVQLQLAASFSSPDVWHAAIVRNLYHADRLPGDVPEKHQVATAEINGSNVIVYGTRNGEFRGVSLDGAWSPHDAWASHIARNVPDGSHSNAPDGSRPHQPGRRPPSGIQQMSVSTRLPAGIPLVVPPPVILPDGTVVTLHRSSAVARDSIVSLTAQGKLRWRSLGDSLAGLLVLPPSGTYKLTTQDTLSDVATRASMAPILAPCASCSRGDAAVATLMGDPSAPTVTAQVPLIPINVTPARWHAPARGPAAHPAGARADTLAVAVAADGSVQVLRVADGARVCRLAAVTAMEQRGGTVADASTEAVTDAGAGTLLSPSAARGRDTMATSRRREWTAAAGGVTSQGGVAAPLSEAPSVLRVVSTPLVASRRMSGSDGRKPGGWAQGGGEAGHRGTPFDGGDAPRAGVQAQAEWQVMFGDTGGRLHALEVQVAAAITMANVSGAGGMGEWDVAEVAGVAVACRARWSVPLSVHPVAGDARSDVADGSARGPPAAAITALVAWDESAGTSRSVVWDGSRDGPWDESKDVAGGSSQPTAGEAPRGLPGAAACLVAGDAAGWLYGISCGSGQVAWTWERPGRGDAGGKGAVGGRGVVHLALVEEQLAGGGQVGSMGDQGSGSKAAAGEGTVVERARNVTTAEGDSQLMAAMADKEAAGVDGSSVAGGTGSSRETGSKGGEGGTSAQGTDEGEQGASRGVTGGGRRFVAALFADNSVAVLDVASGQLEWTQDLCMRQRAAAPTLRVLGRELVMSGGSSAGGRGGGGGGGAGGGGDGGSGGSGGGPQSSPDGSYGDREGNGKVVTSQQGLPASCLSPCRPGKACLFALDAASGTLRWAAHPFVTDGPGARVDSNGQGRASGGSVAPLASSLAGSGGREGGEESGEDKAWVSAQGDEDVPGEEDGRGDAAGSIALVNVWQPTDAPLAPGRGGGAAAAPGRVVAVLARGGSVYLVELKAGAGPGADGDVSPGGVTGGSKLSSDGSAAVQASGRRTAAFPATALQQPLQQPMRRHLLASSSAATPRLMEPPIRRSLLQADAGAGAAPPGDVSCVWPPGGGVGFLAVLPDGFYYAGARVQFSFSALLVPAVTCAFNSTAWAPGSPTQTSPSGAGVRFSLLEGPDDASIDALTGVFTWQVPTSLPARSPHRVRVCACHLAALDAARDSGYDPQASCCPAGCSGRAASEDGSGCASDGDVTGVSCRLSHAHLARLVAVPVPAEVAVSGTVRDFHASHGDFCNDSSLTVGGGNGAGSQGDALNSGALPVVPGLVEPFLVTPGSKPRRSGLTLPPPGPLPTCAPDGNNGQGQGQGQGDSCHGPDDCTLTSLIPSPVTFQDWYEHVPGVNLEAPHALRLTRGGWQNRGSNLGRGRPMYTLREDAFFPIDLQMYGVEGNRHNFHFTYALRTRFTCLGPLHTAAGDGATPDAFNFTSANDLWVFFDGRLVADLGGIHPAAWVEVLPASAGVVPGQEVQVDVFFAQRSVATGSLLALTTSCVPHANEAPRAWPTSLILARGELGARVALPVEDPEGGPLRLQLVKPPEFGSASILDGVVGVEDVLAGVGLEEHAGEFAFYAGQLGYPLLNTSGVAGLDYARGETVTYVSYAQNENDTFAYRVCDDSSCSAPAWVSVSLTGGPGVDDDPPPPPFSPRTDGYDPSPPIVVEVDPLAVAGPAAPPLVDVYPAGQRGTCVRAVEVVWSDASLQSQLAAARGHGNGVLGSVALSLGMLQGDPWVGSFTPVYQARLGADVVASTGLRVVLRGLECGGQYLFRVGGWMDALAYATPAVARYSQAAIVKLTDGTPEAPSGVYTSAVEADVWDTAQGPAWVDLGWSPSQGNGHRITHYYVSIARWLANGDMLTQPLPKPCPCECDSWRGDGRCGGQHCPVSPPTWPGAPCGVDGVDNSTLGTAEAAARSWCMPFLPHQVVAAAGTRGVAGLWPVDDSDMWGWPLNFHAHVPGLLPGTGYCFHVAAVTEQGQSPPSNVVCVTTPLAAPAQPARPLLADALTPVSSEGEAGDGASASNRTARILLPPLPVAAWTAESGREWRTLRDNDPVTCLCVLHERVVPGLTANASSSEPYISAAAAMAHREVPPWSPPSLPWWDASIMAALLYNYSTQAVCEQDPAMNAAGCAAGALCRLPRSWPPNLADGANLGNDSWRVDGANMEEGPGLPTGGCQLSGLEPGASYWVWVIGLNQNGPGWPSAPLRVDVPPEPCAGDPGGTRLGAKELMPPALVGRTQESLRWAWRVPAVGGAPLHTHALEMAPASLVAGTCSRPLDLFGDDEDGDIYSGGSQPADLFLDYTPLGNFTPVVGGQPTLQAVEGVDDYLIATQWVTGLAPGTRWLFRLRVCGASGPAVDASTLVAVYFGSMVAKVLPHPELSTRC